MRAADREPCRHGNSIPTAGSGSSRCAIIPTAPTRAKPPLGRIRILEDKDGDGFFETSTIWADNLLFANGLLLWQDGAIVTMAPKITHLRDTKGDRQGG